MNGGYPPDKMGIKATESSSLIRLSRLPAFSLMRTMILVSGKREGNISLRVTAFPKVTSLLLLPTRSAR